MYKPHRQWQIQWLWVRTGANKAASSNSVHEVLQIDKVKKENEPQQKMVHYQRSTVHTSNHQFASAVVHFSYKIFKMKKNSANIRHFDDGALVNGLQRKI